MKVLFPERTARTMMSEKNRRLYPDISLKIKSMCSALLNNRVHALLDVNFPHSESEEVFFRRGDGMYVSLEDPSNTINLSLRNSFVSMVNGKAEHFDVDETGYPNAYRKIRDLSNEAFSKEPPALTGASYGCDYREFLALSMHVLYKHICVNSDYKAGCGTGDAVLNALSGRVTQNKHIENAWVDGFVMPPVADLAKLDKDLKSFFKGTKFIATIDQLSSGGIVTSENCNELSRMVESSLICEPIKITPEMRAAFIAEEGQSISFEAEYLNSGYERNFAGDLGYVVKVRDLASGLAINLVSGREHEFKKSDLIRSRAEGVPLSISGVVKKNTDLPAYPRVNGVLRVDFVSEVKPLSVGLSQAAPPELVFTGRRLGSN